MREILTVPDGRLRMKSFPIENIDESVKSLAQEMLDMLTPTESVGLAAPQLGELIRLIVIRIPGIEIVLINPVLRKPKKLHWVLESCRSIPDKIFKVQRPNIVSVNFLNLDSMVRTIKAHDLFAQVLCHEIDHLDGVMLDKKGLLL